MLVSLLKEVNLKQSIKCLMKLCLDHIKGIGGTVHKFIESIIVDMYALSLYFEGGFLPMQNGQHKVLLNKEATFQLGFWMFLCG